MSGQSFGVTKDGTLERCRAKPENRGRGRCFHSDHVEFTDKDVAYGAVDKFNEDVLKKSFGAASYLTPLDSVSEVSSVNGRSLSREEFISAADKLSESFSNDDYAFFSEFEDIYRQRLLNPKLRKRYESSVSNIEGFLNSKDEDAVRIREFLGPDVNIRDFSEICVSEVSAMTHKEKWRPRRSGLRRVILTNVVNDMTKKRYLASVLFFGGRCVYCHKPLRKRPPKNLQATGEHLTALSPSGSSKPFGSTRYGNMALACFRCNQARGNKDLVDFIQTSDTIPDAKRVECLARIKAFRRFALYEEFSKEDNEQIRRSIESTRSKIDSLRLPNGVIPDERIDEARTVVKAAIFDLKSIL